jgi:hypothetical protein
VKQPVLKKLRYAPLPWDTHPIDTAPDQPQGWGPFNGPYSPWDFIDPATFMGMSGINIGYNTDVYQTDHAPGYHDITVFEDRSTASVNNVLVKAANDGSPQMTPGVTYTSTIANSLNRAREQSGNGPSVADLLSRLKNAVNIGG